MSTVQNTIDRQITIKAPQEKVYNAIVDPAQITAWFPDGIEGTIAPGERPILDFGEYGKNQIYVVATDPFDYVAYNWLPGSAGFLGDVLGHPHTLVEFRLSSGPEGTTVKLTESGFASLPLETAQKQLEDNSGGWEYMLDRLQALFSQA